MKILIGLLLCATALTFAQTNDTNTVVLYGFTAGKGVGIWTNKEGYYVIKGLLPTAPEVIIKRCRDEGTLTNLVNALVADGSFCQVRGGHKWEFGCGVTGCLVIHAGPMRHCAVCGATETQEVGPWK